MNFFVSYNEVVPIDLACELGAYKMMEEVLSRNGIPACDVEIRVRYTTKDTSIFVSSSVHKDDSNRAVQEVKEVADFNCTTGITAHWVVKSFNVYKFGKWGSKILSEIRYCSSFSCDIITMVRSNLRQDGALESDRFELLVLSADGRLVEVNQTNFHLMANKYVFVNFLQLPYPELNYTIWKHFDSKCKDVSATDYLTALKQDDNDQAIFLRKLEDTVVALRQQYATRWEDHVTDATNELIEWSQSVPPQRGFNAATRQVVVHTMCRHVSMLTAHTVYIGVPQHLGITPPAYMLGSGPVDVKVGAAVVIWARDKVVAQDVSRGEAMNCDEETESHKFPPPVDRNDPFPQLCGACYDAAFVTAEEHQRLAGEVGDAADPANIKPVNEYSRKRPLETSAWPVTRAHKHISGFLMTGQAWEVISFSTSTFEAADKYKSLITYLATLPLPVLHYAEDRRRTDGGGFSNLGVSIEALQLSDTRSYGSAGTSTALRDQVERVLAALVLGAQGRLTA